MNIFEHLKDAGFWNDEKQRQPTCHSDVNPQLCECM
jgi:hypothetical protein